MTGRSYRTSEFDYELPAELIAQHPGQRRDESRLLILDRTTGAIRHGVFRDLLGLVPPGDALVLNETRVFPARLVGRRAGGGAAEILLLHPVEADASPAPASPGTGAERRRRPEDRTGMGAGGRRGARDPRDWEALVRPGGRLRPGRFVEISPELHVEILAVTPDGHRIVRLHSPLVADEAIARHGRVPLPPYVRREPGPEDAERYQTVYAREIGSVAAPTAGLHFTPALLDALAGNGVELVRLVLHVGAGTFRPVEAEDPEAHVMHPERYTVPEGAAAALNRIRGAGNRVWAVGTTVVRTLETVTGDDGAVHPGSGWTRLFIRPPYRFRCVDRLVTNFHLPRSTLLMLVAAFGGYDRVMAAYREAVARRYRFYSYGDAMLVV